ncbi:molybdate ABC transporter permease subunit [Microbacterium oxydans]|uniref:molybdate ABC transporter permease subunit n=2 Tax=Microbacteriaceae TaxID=85023 RepID=UPI00114471B4|nr:MULTISPECIES: molybdate ABC transporter permease subunit [Microbacterium]KAB1889895.1 molybdate ABC transporter permease subunit [Microbacterium oxydans]MBE7955843.1 molybdate ABC transporter permease subunit [Microbacterium sp. R1]MCB8043897.1 molybdate ABC transporter permease subunit [Microbacterium oxydans]GED40291.1 molybdenum transport system permease protein ModB [Microbacterium oxydans]
MSAAGGRGYAPRALAIPAAIGLAFLILPLIALVARVQWSTFLADVTSQAALSALLLSLGTGLVATLLCIVVGVPLALYIARSGPRLAAVLRAVVTVPLVLPPMVGGVALLYLFGRAGWFGGLGLSFSTPAVVLAQTFVALPFLVLAVEGAVRTSGVDHERTAAALGAGRWTILRRITLPIAAPGIVAGVVLCFARAIGEFGATALFAGNRPGVTQTMPLAIYTAFNGAGVSQGTAVALALLLLATAIVVLLLVRGWRPGAAR